MIITHYLLYGLSELDTFMDSMEIFVLFFQNKFTCVNEILQEKMQNTR